MTEKELKKIEVIIVIDDIFQEMIINRNKGGELKIKEKNDKNETKKEISSNVTEKSNDIEIYLDENLKLEKKDFKNFYRNLKKLNIKEIANLSPKNNSESSYSKKYKIIDYEYIYNIDVKKQENENVDIYFINFFSKEILESFEKSDYFQIILEKGNNEFKVDIKAKGLNKIENIFREFYEDSEYNQIRHIFEKHILFLLYYLIKKIDNLDNLELAGLVLDVNFLNIFVPGKPKSDNPLSIDYGFDILEFLRNNKNSPFYYMRKVPIILATKYGDTKHIIGGIRKGADGYVIKNSGQSTQSVNSHGTIITNKKNNDYFERMYKTVQEIWEIREVIENYIKEISQHFFNEEEQGHEKIWEKIKMYNQKGLIPPHSQELYNFANNLHKYYDYYYEENIDENDKRNIIDKIINRIEIFDHNKYSLNLEILEEFEKLLFKERDKYD